jgi:hypothetical protein
MYGEKRNVFRVMLGKSEVKRGKPRWVDNIKMVLK